MEIIANIFIIGALYELLYAIIVGSELALILCVSFALNAFMAFEIGNLK